MRITNTHYGLPKTTLTNVVWEAQIGFSITHLEYVNLHQLKRQRKPSRFFVIESYIRRQPTNASTPSASSDAVFEIQTQNLSTKFLSGITIIKCLYYTIDHNSLSSMIYSYAHTHAKMHQRDLQNNRVRLTMV